MSEVAKYIIVDMGGMEVPIVFSPLMAHADVAKGIGMKVISAGFCEVMNDSFGAYGESFSLGLKSRLGQDADVLNRHLNYFNSIS